VEPIEIDEHLIGKKHPPFIIAEMSGNHNGSLERALAIVEAAAAAGAHAVKLQTYTADTMTLDLAEGEFFINDPENLWQGKSLYRLYQEAATPWEWHEPIFRRCRELGLVGFSTPFDATAVDFLENLGAPCYKIAAFENTDLPLIRKVAATGKPLFISTGMASAGELEETVSAARAAGCPEVVLLKCTSAYPAPPEEANLLTIPHLRELFRRHVGLSDHTLGIGTAVAAIALGAVAIEKHLTLSRAEGGVDADFSLEPAELKTLVEEADRAWRSLGRVSYGPGRKEQASLKHRRSLYIVADLEAGEVLTPENLRAIRPGLGLAPKFYELVLGKPVKKGVKKGTPLSWELLL
jgi:pseudaminic acid synthase